ncbi:uncharacterized protein STEHIDRAFT_160671 [Stereum hirsutum FP-91666 SS1]|uniref:uncharacterized protein n=1 Tax=Stereum hirsutum (strain FP-91666) TaxID=721885 RepID=UPI000444A786|nr:uncharacterized protein STEHIDRAFT_160671 [Stereum hirsutum FP-91666 SS1]EIM83065.1 hypothetical protein STEHIDRAFT_160671 [Stereum hirsutum FP-91666 SS1]
MSFFTRAAKTATFVAASAQVAQAYWLMAATNNLVQQRMDPIVNPGAVSGHNHNFVGGSNLDFNLSTASLRESECTSIPVAEDNSVYWHPELYFQWANGSFTSVDDYLFDDDAATAGVQAFPDDFRMISGETTLRSYNASSFAQQAVTFLCIAEDGSTTKTSQLPANECAFSMRAQINFPKCWDGVNVDSDDHKSHVAFPSGGPDSGTCDDPNFPVTLPRIFMEVYYSTSGFDWSQGKNTSQPFVYSNGDPTGFGYHADFFNGWKSGVLQNAVDGCNCNEYGDPTCCVDAGIFTMQASGSTCSISAAIEETVLGELASLPGNNPVVGFGAAAEMLTDTVVPAILSPVIVTKDGTASSGTATVEKAAYTLASAASSVVSAATSSAASEATHAVSAAGLAVVTSSEASATSTSAAATATSSKTCKVSKKREEEKKRSIHTDSFAKRQHRQRLGRAPRPHAAAFTDKSF